MSKLRTITLSILAVLTLTSARAQLFEVGYQLDHRGSAAFAYVTHDFSLGNLGSIGLWFSPSVEVVVGPSFVDGWLQAQLLVDAPWATLSLRGKYEMIDQRQRAELRLGLLLGQ